MSSSLFRSASLHSLKIRFESRKRSSVLAPAAGASKSPLLIVLPTHSPALTQEVKRKDTGEASGAGVGSRRLQKKVSPSKKKRTQPSGSSCRKITFERSKAAPFVQASCTQTALQRLPTTSSRKVASEALNRPPTSGSAAGHSSRRWHFMDHGPFDPSVSRRACRTRRGCQSRTSCTRLRLHVRAHGTCRRRGSTR